MSTIQIVGIAVAAVIVVLLVIALVVTRKSGDDEASGARDSAAGSSFLDSAPSDTLAKLGKPEHLAAPASHAGEESGPIPASPAKVVMTATGVAAAANGGLGLDWDHPDERTPKAPPSSDETETTGEMPGVAAPAMAGEGSAGKPVVEAEPAEEAPTEAAETEAAAPAPSDNLVPLSSIIVTTSTKMVDLEDPEIRRMLTDLVTFEIDQATQFREQGQTIDAVLQLTEAEKICRALGKHDTAREIRDMMRGLQT
jgi:hypothetical protein